MRSPKIEIYRSERARVRWHQPQVGDPVGIVDEIPEYRWRHRAANGRIVAESGEGYLEPRNLVRGLEIAHPGHGLARVDGFDRSGRPTWGWVLRRPFTVAACDIPVTVPEGTESLWAARRNR